MFAIRHALLEEYDTVAEFACEAVEPCLVEAEPGARDAVRATVRLRAGGELIVATIDSEIAASVVYVPPGEADAEDPSLAALRVLATRAAFRRRGAARQLTRACTTLARADGTSRLAIVIPEDAPGAQAFCAAAGLTPAGDPVTRLGLACRTWRLAL